MIEALVKELELRKIELKNSIVETIYFGGGTPSLLTIEELRLLIKTIYKNYKVVENPEITLEANPDDLSDKQINKLTNTQINRLSIGIQSFFEEDLKAMNRAHNAEEAKKCLSMATRHFDNITIDLIYGIPNMTNERWKENLQIAFDFGVNHISSYALTVEPKTALDSFIRQGKYPKLSDELAQQHFNILVAETAKKGFVHYEISNFGKEGFFSKHNASYWLGKPYLGIGPSAHSFNGKERSWNIANNIKYIKAIRESELPREVEKLSDADRFNEQIMTGLRTVWGVSLDAIETEFGLPVKEKLLKNAQKFIDKGLLVISNISEKSHVIANGMKQPVFSSEITSSLAPRNDEVLKTTQKGKFLADGLASELFIVD